jgi:hypothetical protein
MPAPRNRQDRSLARVCLDSPAESQAPVDASLGAMAQRATDNMADYVPKLLLVCAGVLVAGLLLAWGDVRAQLQQHAHEAVLLVGVGGPGIGGTPNAPPNINSAVPGMWPR